jgi:hypothetical protein
MRILNKWFASPKGYTATFLKGNVTVFWTKDTWKVVCDEGYRGPFPDLNRALTVAEKLMGQWADRTVCVDVSPYARFSVSSQSQGCAAACCPFLRCCVKTNSFKPQARRFA